MHTRRFLGAALAALCLMLIASPADAHRGKRVSLSPVPGAGAVVDDRFAHLRLPEAYATARAWPKGAAIGSLAAPARFIAGRLICARNVNAALAKRGILGTGSAMAKSFLNWGRPSAPVPGAVAVFHRGSPKSPSGHVAIVAKVEDGQVWLWNPAPQGWQLAAAHRPAIAHRSPS